MSCLHCLLQLFQQQLRTAFIGIQSIPAAMIGKCAVIQLYDSIFFSQRLLRKYIAAPMMLPFCSASSSAGISTSTALAVLIR